MDNDTISVRPDERFDESCLAEYLRGKLEGTDSPEETAARELKEETGYTAGRLQKIASFYTSPGFADENLLKGVQYIRSTPP